MDGWFPAKTKWIQNYPKDTKTFWIPKDTKTFNPKMMAGRMWRERGLSRFLTRLLTSQSQPHSVRVDPAPTIAAYHTEKVRDNIIVT
jgi:hypothetical protein